MNKLKLYNIKENFKTNLIVSSLPIINNVGDVNKKIFNLFGSNILNIDNKNIYLDWFDFSDDDMKLSDDKNIFEHRHLYTNKILREKMEIDDKFKISYFLFPFYNKNKHIVVFMSFNQNIKPDLSYLRDGDIKRNFQFNAYVIGLISQKIIMKDVSINYSLSKILGKIIICPESNNGYTTGFGTKIDINNNILSFVLKLEKYKDGSDYDNIDVLSFKRNKLTKKEKKRHNITSDMSNFYKSRLFAYIKNYESIKKALELIGILDGSKLDDCYFKNNNIFIDFFKMENDLININITYNKQDYNLLNNDNKDLFLSYIDMLKDIINENFKEIKINILIIENINDLLDKDNIIFIDLINHIYKSNIENISEKNNIIIKDNEKIRKTKKEEKEENNNIFILKDNIYTPYKFNTTYQILLDNKCEIYNQLNNNFNTLLNKYFNQFDLYTQIKLYNLWLIWNNKKPIIVQNIKYIADKEKDYDEKKKKNNIIIIKKIISELFIKTMENKENIIKKTNYSLLSSNEVIYVNLIKNKTNSAFNRYSYLHIDYNTGIINKGWCLESDFKLIKNKYFLYNINFDNSGYYIIFDKNTYLFKSSENILPHVIINNHVYDNINNIIYESNNFNKHGDVILERSLTSKDKPFYGIFYPSFKNIISEKNNAGKNAVIVDFKNNDMWLYFSYNTNIQSSEKFIALDCISLFKKQSERTPFVKVNIIDYPDYYFYYLKNITKNLIKNTDDIAKVNLFFKFIDNILS